MNLNFNTYKDKVRACWLGKNIGGTMGTPYEGTREFLDVKGFVTKPGEVLPNDDLDLQLVWLYALENCGPHAIDAALLGEYWLSFITPHWNEYGLGKANMERGLQAPLSGDYRNSWKHSNGAWIRTEIWACTAPGAPETAARYAMEDAKVDHGCGEGTYAAAFVAAMQSAAFLLKDIRSCIEVGLAAVPAESRIAQSVRFVMDCYDSKKTPREAREAILALNADIGDGWFEAPSNVAYTVLGLLYGEGDFKHSMLHAINCGDDTDCTAATVGATLGILGGMDAVPEDWRAYIGDSIVTISIAKGNRGGTLPKTCEALTERVVKLAPLTLLANHSAISLTDADSTLAEEACEILLNNVRTDERLQVAMRYLKPYSLHFETPMYEAFVCLEQAPEIEPLGTCKLHIDFVGKTSAHENKPYNLTMRWLLPEGFSATGAHHAVRIEPWSNHSKDHSVDVDFVITAGEKTEATNRLVLEVVAEGRPTILYIPITLLG